MTEAGGAPLPDTLQRHCRRGPLPLTPRRSGEEAMYAKCAENIVATECDYEFAMLHCVRVLNLSRFAFFGCSSTRKTDFRFRSCNATASSELKLLQNTSPVH